MPIIDITVQTRPDTNTPFWLYSNDTAISTFNQAVAPLGSKFVKSTSLDNDGLTCTFTNTYEDFETISAVYSARTPAHRIAQMSYNANHGIQSNLTTFSGVGTAFTVTTVYSAPSLGASSLHTLFFKFSKHVAIVGLSTTSTATITDQTVTLIELLSEQNFFEQKFAEDLSLSQELVNDNVSKTVVFSA